MSDTRKRTTAIDEETGEYIEFIEWREGDSLQSKEQKVYFYDKMERYADKTDFVWLKYAYNEDYYSSIASENLTRLMYFATFCSSDCYVMQNADLKLALNISSNQAKSFRDEFVERVIFNRGTRLYLNNELFGKGKVETTDKDYIRLFTSTTRQLYETCRTTSEHAYLAYFFRMIPFINRQTNILCTNQNEQEIEHVAYMTASEFFNFIGKTHISRLKTILQSYRVNGELVIGYFDTLNTLTPKGKYVVINPILYYGGDRTKASYGAIRKLFLTEKENNLLNEM